LHSSSLSRPPPPSPLFPYTTLFRSGLALALALAHGGDRACNLGAAQIGFHQHPVIRRQLADVARQHRVIQRRLAYFTGQHCVVRSEEHTSELQSRENLVCRLLLEKK